MENFTRLYFPALECCVYALTQLLNFLWSENWKLVPETLFLFASPSSSLSANLLENEIDTYSVYQRSENETHETYHHIEDDDGEWLEGKCRTVERVEKIFASFEGAKARNERKKILRFLLLHSAEPNSRRRVYVNPGRYHVRCWKTQALIYLLSIRQIIKTLRGIQSLLELMELTYGVSTHQTTLVYIIFSEMSKNHKERVCVKISPWCWGDG